MTVTPTAVAVLDRISFGVVAGQQVEVDGSAGADQGAG
jgi:hypothetical protein